MNQRLLSLDAFRGFTIAAMLLVNNPGDWSRLYGPLAHAAWDGWTFTDTIFPFFVFISGISMTLSFSRRKALGDTRLALLGHTTWRALVIIAVGLTLNLVPAFNLAELRIPGVLQRLGLCALLAAPIVLYCDWRQQLGWLLGLLIGYTLLMTLVPVPDAQGLWHTGSLQPGQDVGAWLDRFLMDGHLWRTSKTWDPEGLLSTLPAVASMLAGALAGHWLAARRDPIEKTAWLLVAGLLLLCAGQVLSAWSMPINKNLWTPSYVLLMAGWACLAFGAFYWLLDASPLPMLRKRMAGLAHPMVVLGMNALFIFALSGLLARMLAFIKLDGGLSLKAWLYAPIQAAGLAPVNASLLYALAFSGFMYIIAWGMWRKRWFVKV